MYDFKEIEKEAKNIVKKKEIEKAVSDDKKRKKMFSFLEGPPTANAPPGLHHLEVRTFKDIINKFRYMSGYNVPRKAGWDCHGLPVEVQIEKKLGLNSKKDIIKHGEAKFIKECKDSVFSYIKTWNQSTERLGYWVDLENRYATLDNNYIESVWWSLKELYNKKLLYEAHKVVPFCPRCETPLSSHELAQGYEKVNENTIVVKFQIRGKKNEYLLIWTTTPWTLPSNLAIAVNPCIDYSYVKEEENSYILAKELVKNFFPDAKVLKTVKGKSLVGMNYIPIMPYYEKLDAFRVIGGDFVSTEDGTGIVHMAPAFGEVDYEACKKEKLPFVQPVDENGKFNKEVPDYEGKFIKDCDADITTRLDSEGKLFKRVRYEHDYPFCWRCSSPLMYYAIKSWFIRVTKEKKRLIELAKKINWTPKHIKEGRFGEWLENVKDWALSRNKFWGTPLPVWRCECGNEEMVGSVEELKKKSSRKLVESEIDLHKPWIDSVKLKCSKCKKEMKRVSEVIDCWYDSGSASFAQFHYPFENKKEFSERFPYDFIAEAIDQTRGWFYTLHVLGTLLFNDNAYKNVICAGHIVDEKGEKMSKSKGNILNPDQVMDEVGVDATRLQFCTVDIGAFKRFSISLVKEEVLPFLNVLWNTYQFYTQIDGKEKAEKRIEDKWILSRLNSTIKETTEQLNNYQIEKAVYPIMDFVVNDFSKKYIKMIRDREDKGVGSVVGEVIDAVSRLLAPYAPNISEVIHSKFGKESVHLSSWPKFSEKAIDKKLDEEFASAMKIIEVGLRERDIVHIGLKWPLAGAEIACSSKISKEVQEIIMRQLNVKKLNQGSTTPMPKDKEVSVKLDVEMTEELENEGFAREISRAIQAERKKASLVKTDRINLQVFSKDSFVERIKNQESFIKERTGAKTIKIINISDDKTKKLESGTKLKIKDVDFEVYFEKV